MLEAERKCIKCEEIKPIELFVKRGQGYKGVCKECYRSYHNNYAAANQSKLAVTRSFNRNSRELKGLCRYCKLEAIPNKRVCEKHYIIDISSKTLGVGNIDIAKELLRRFHENPYCPYTGDPLMLGVNAHLDHILSLKNRPDLKGDIDNVEWVSETANLSKNGFNKDEFIKFCKLVSRRFE